MSSKVITIISALGIILGICLYKQMAPQKKSCQITIGILQTASHPALDQVKKGFIDELTSLTDGKIDFIIQNGEGSLPQIQSIAANYHAHKKVQAVFAIATPAVQAITKYEKEKPIFIAAVSEPESLGLNQNTNVCGTTDRVDTDKQSKLIKELLPLTQRVAILYNPGESNSVATVKKMESSLKKHSMSSFLVGINLESEISMAVISASRKSDLLLIPADNLLVGAMPLVAYEALKNKTPLIVSDIPSVSKGALAATGADYRDLGKQTAQLAYQVLIEGKTPNEVGIQDPLYTKTVIQQKCIDSLQIALPDSQNYEIVGKQEMVR